MITATKGRMKSMNELRADLAQTLNDLHEKKITPAEARRRAREANATISVARSALNLHKASNKQSPIIDIEAKQLPD
jgi:hypothetical protein